jgi:hypothetical protein
MNHFGRQIFSGAERTAEAFVLADNRRIDGMAAFAAGALLAAVGFWVFHGVWLKKARFWALNF